MNHNLYEKDKIEMDFQINKYTLKCLRTMLFAILGIWLLNILHIFVVNQELMSTGITITSCILICILIFGKIVDLRKKWVKYILIALTICCITVLGVTLTYHTLLLSVVPLLIATQYTDRKTLIYTFILTVISTLCNSGVIKKWG